MGGGCEYIVITCKVRFFSLLAPLRNQLIGSLIVDCKNAAVTKSRSSNELIELTGVHVPQYQAVAMQ